MKESEKDRLQDEVLAKAAYELMDLFYKFECTDLISGDVSVNNLETGDKFIAKLELKKI